MKLPRRNFLHLAAGAAALPTTSRFAWAQAYPSRPVRLIVTVGAGGAPDIIARLIGQWLSERLGQPIVVDNRPGGNGNIGTEIGVRAPPDGYTLLLALSLNAINAALYENLSFNFIRDTAPVASLLFNSVARMLMNRGRRHSPQQFSSPWRGKAACGVPPGLNDLKENVELKRGELELRLRLEEQAGQRGGAIYTVDANVAERLGPPTARAPSR
jgi:tripartite tricarboxylate transporter family receptor